MSRHARRRRYSRRRTLTNVLRHVDTPSSVLAALLGGHRDLNWRVACYLVARGVAPATLRRALWFDGVELSEWRRAQAFRRRFVFSPPSFFY